MDRLRRFTPLIGVAIAAGALWLIGHELRGYNLHDIGAQLRALPAWRLGVALGLTALNYGWLSFYDALALRYAREDVPYRKSAFASVVGFAFSISLGHAVLTGGAARYRLYTAWGVPAEAIAKVVAFSGLAFWVGYLSLGGLVFLVAPPPTPAGFPVPPRVLGVAFVAAFGVWIGINAVLDRPLQLGRWTIDVPGVPMTLGQAFIASVDLAVAALVLFVLLPAGSVPYEHLLAIYLLAVIAGVVSLVPGGLGVFDGVLVALLAPTVPAASVVGALVAYRAVYYLLPLALASLALLAHEGLHHRGTVAGHLTGAAGVAGRGARLAGAVVPRLVPHALAVATFAAGSVLLVTGALPAIPDRMAWLSRAVPLGAVEVSHFVGSVAGAALLVVARGLWLRRDGAFWAAAALLALGSTAALVRGVDVVEATVLALALGALLPFRRLFTRRSALLSGPALPGWGLAVGLVLVATVALGVFATREVAYADRLWWRVAFEADAPRFLRGTAGAAGVVLVAGLVRLMRASPRTVGVDPTAHALGRVRAILAQSGDTEANLALLGDKRLLFAPDAEPGGPDDGFVMYAAQGQSWIAMGGPVGPEETREALMWAFRGAAEAAGARPVVYEAPERDLPLLLDIGLVPYKLGEEATVPLAGPDGPFSLDGSHRKKLRQSLRKTEALGFTFEVSDDTEALLPDLRRVSDTWLGGKAGQEKGFSLGLFRDDYVAQFPVALVRSPEGALVAFATLWANDRLRGGGVAGPATRDELSVDLMRFDRASAPPGVMETLFTQLLLWGAAEGYRSFSLGMAPLSGLESGVETRALAPLWNRAGALLYRHGEHVYNFQGLRLFKSKFDPVWVPRYLAVPRGRLALAQALVDVTARVSGGLSGLIRK